MFTHTSKISIFAPNRKFSLTLPIRLTFSQHHCKHLSQMTDLTEYEKCMCEISKLLGASHKKCLYVVRNVIYRN